MKKLLCLILSLGLNSPAFAGVTYSPANNKIIVTGYSSGTPCTFTDLYTEDKAGMLSLHYRTGIAGTDGAPVAVTTALRPADYVVLGGASNDLWITIANWIGTTATIQITGTDRDGVAQTENIVVNANGSYSTVNWYKTITHTQVTVFTATSFDYYLLQGQWGVVWRGDIFYNDHYFKVDCGIHLGDANNDAYFGDKNKVIFFTLDWYDIITSEAGKGHVYLGERGSVDEKTGKNGCIFKANVYMGPMIKDPAELFCYDSVFSNDSPWLAFSSVDINGTTGEIWNSRFNNVDIKGVAGDIDLCGITISDSVDVAFGDFSTTGTMNDISAYEVRYFFEAYPGTSINIKNVVGRHIHEYLGLFFSQNAETHYGINWDVSWNANDYSGGLFYWTAHQDLMFYRQYTFNLKVTDKDGNGIGGATVILKDKDGNTADQKGFETTTSDDPATRGEIPEQIVSYGYYNQANGDTLQSYSPHTITISKKGYLTYRKSFELDEKVNWKIGLKHSPYSNIVGIE